MKKETIGFMLGLFVLFGGYFAVNNHYAQKQQQEMNERQNNLKATQPKNHTSPNESMAATPQATTSIASNVQSQATSLPVPEKEVALQPLTVANPADLIIKKSYATFEFTPVGGCLGNNS